MLREKGVVLSLDESARHVRYKAPKGALTDDDRAALRARQAEVLRFLRARAAAVRRPFRPGRGGAVPSFTQELWWRSARAAPTQHRERRIPLLLPFADKPAAAVLAAVEAVIARHEALRYSFVEHAGTLEALVNDPGSFQVEIEPLPPGSFRGGDLPPPVVEFVAAVPPLEGKWLTRARVFLEPAGQGMIVLIVHHIICDGTSLGIIADDLFTLLAEMHAGSRPGPLAALPAGAPRFGDFAAWERECFQGEVAERFAAFWGGWLAAVPPLKCPDTGTALEWAPGERVDYGFAFALTEAGEPDRLARELKVTPFTLLLALFCLCLSRWAGQSRYAILSVADGRVFPDTLGLGRTVGPILHMDPIEIDLSEAPELPNVVRMLQTNCAAARELRFPLNGCLAGLREHEFIHKIGATFNYRDLRETGGARAAALAAAARPDPGSRGPEPVTADRYDVPLQPINLRMEQSETTLAGTLEFNDELLPRTHQRVIVDRLLDALGELLKEASWPHRP